MHYGLETGNKFLLITDEVTDVLNICSAVTTVGGLGEVYQHWLGTALLNGTSGR